MRHRHGEAGEPSDADDTGEGADSWAAHMDGLARIERNQESVLAQLDGLPPAIYALMEDRDNALAVSDSATDPAEDTPTVSVSSLSPRRDALMQLRNRIYMEEDVQANGSEMLRLDAGDA